MISFREIAERMDSVRPPARLRGSSVAWLDENDAKTWLANDEVVQTVSSFPPRTKIGLWHKSDKGLLQMHRWPKERDPFSGKGIFSLHAIARRHANHPAWTFKFLLYNTWLLRSGPFNAWVSYPEWEQRRSEIGQMIAKDGYHIVGLCEVFKEDDRQAIQDEVGKLHYYEWARGPEHDIQASSGLMTLAIDKAGILSFQGKAFDEQGGGVDSLAEKGVLYTELELRPPGSNLRPHLDLFITHLHAKEIDTRREQIKEVESFVMACHKPQNPIIVAGDFNADCRNNPIDPLFGGEYTFLLSRMSNLNLYDVWLSHGGLAGGTSITADKPGYNPDYTTVCEFAPSMAGSSCIDYPASGLNNQDRVPGEPLDYVFVEEPNSTHSIIIDIPRVRRLPFWRGPYSLYQLDHKRFYSDDVPYTGDDIPNFMSDHLGLEMDLIVTPMSEI